MRVSHCCTPLYLNPSLLPGVVSVMAWLAERGYSAAYREVIGRHVHRTGELAGAVLAGLLDREDEHTATEIFVEALPDLDDESPAWDREDVLIDVELALAGRHPLPFTVEPPDAPDAHWRHPYADVAGLAAAALEDLPLPISGGSPESDPGPTAADRADYEAWLDQVGRVLPPRDQVDPPGIFPESLVTRLYGPNRYA
jgi:hypothetical protein